MKDQLYIVLGSNSDQKVQAFGTKTGKVFKTERSANQAMRRMAHRFPSVDFLVLPVCEESP